VVEKRNDLPDLAVRHDLAPCWHGRPAHAAPDDAEVLVVGQMGCAFMNWGPPNRRLKLKNCRRREHKG